jgi:hypothetical protein
MRCRAQSFDFAKQASCYPQPTPSELEWAGVNLFLAHGVVPPPQAPGP